MPSDLKNTDWDDPEMITRFKELIDFYEDTVNFTVSSVNIGSEYDVLFGSSKSEWQEFITFFKEVGPYIKKKFPGVKLAIEPIFESMIDSSTKGYIKELNSITDVVGVSYYGMKKNGMVEDPEIVHQTFKEITRARRIKS